MVIEQVPYIHVDDTVGFSISASLWMLLMYNGYTKYSAAEINDMFCHTFISQNFHDHFKGSLHISTSGISEAVSCAIYMVNEMLPGIRASTYQLDFRAIKYSFIKRHIPVMITGSFPVINDKIQNSIVIKGYVDDYLVVNDPRGDAYSGYRDSYGENHLYKIDDLEKWTEDTKVYIFRLHK